MVRMLRSGTRPPVVAPVRGPSAQACIRNSSRHAERVDRLRAVVASLVDGHDHGPTSEEVPALGRGRRCAARPGGDSRARGGAVSRLVELRGARLLSARPGVLGLDPHGLYKPLLRERGVCRVDVSALLDLHPDELADRSRVIIACRAGAPDSRTHPPGARKPFRMSCGRDLTSEPCGPRGTTRTR